MILPTECTHRLLDPHRSVDVNGCCVSSVSSLSGGYQVCLPSAKLTTSFSFEVAVTFGGPHCYGDNWQRSTFPARGESGAPIGGWQYDRLLAYQTQVCDLRLPSRYALRIAMWVFLAVQGSIILNATDPNGDALTFTVTMLPARGALFYSLDAGVTLVPVVAGQPLPAGANTLYFTPANGQGGAPYASLSYRASDGLLNSSQATIRMFVTCPAGTAYATDGSGNCGESQRLIRWPSLARCGFAVKCRPGSYQPLEGLNSACIACPAQQYQDQPGEHQRILCTDIVLCAGQHSCKPCVAGVNYQPSPGSSSCIACPTQLVSTSILGLDASNCLTNVQTQTDGSLAVSLLQDSGSNGAATMLFVSTLPRLGSLHQVDAAGNPGAAITDAFYTSATPEVEQWASILVSASTARSGHPATAALGLPDVANYVSSPNAYSPSPPTDNSTSTMFITLGFAAAVYAEDILVYQVWL